MTDPRNPRDPADAADPADPVDPAGRLDPAEVESGDRDDEEQATANRPTGADDVGG